MKSRSLRQISLTALGIFLLYVLLFSTANVVNPSNRELQNTPLDDMVWRFIYGVRNCLKAETDYFEARASPFQEYWRRLPAISDSCGVNPQISVRTYPTSQQFNFLFIPNMNKEKDRGDCRIVSYVGEKFKEIEARIKRENPDCTISNSNLEGKSWREVAKGSREVERLTSLFIKPPTEEVRSVVDGLLSPEGFSVCQVNLLYPEPSTRAEGQFISDFNRLLTEGKYLLLKAEKDFSSTFMNLFLVNFSDEFCRSRYFRMYTFD